MYVADQIHLICQWLIGWLADGVMYRAKQQNQSEH
jgi:hypothetical protein